MEKRLSLIAVAVAAVSIPVAPAQSATQVGTLACTMGPTVGLVVGSVQRMSCAFHANDGTTEIYAGSFRRVGLDLGITAGGRLAWAVYAKTSHLGHRALVGKYIGASGDVAFGFGIGANALVGGSRSTVTLQPVSIEGQVGVSVALGAAGLRLQ